MQTQAAPGLQTIPLGYRQHLDLQAIPSAATKVICNKSFGLQANSLGYMQTQAFLGLQTNPVGYRQSFGLQGTPWVARKEFCNKFVATLESFGSHSNTGTT